MRMQRATGFVILIINLLAPLPIMAAAVAASPIKNHSEDTLIRNKTIVDGQTLISSGGKFEMGFFSPEKSTNRYLGIWFYNISVQTVVWVANRATPLSSSDTGKLHLSPDGNLVLSNEHGRAFWSTGTSMKGTNPALKIRDSGNLVLINKAKGSGELVIWQSFDHPTDTYLSGMKVGVDYQHNISWQYTSWRSPNDPSPGDYCIKFSNYDVPEIHIWKGSHKIARFYGPWDWKAFNRSNYVFKMELIKNVYGGYFSASLENPSTIISTQLNATGSLQVLYWDSSLNKWTCLNKLPWDICDNYATCGANGICDPSSSSICSCLNGFVPKSPGNWNTGKYSNGCTREAEALKCSSSDTFTLLHNMKMPDTEDATSDRHMNLDQCRKWCLRNCSCTAYAVLGATGCVIWHHNMYDIRESSGSGDDLYVRNLSSGKNSPAGNKKRLLVIILASTFGFLLVFIGLLLCLKKRTGQNQVIETSIIRSEGEDDAELPLYDIRAIQDATSDFSIHNILGKGGFGTVFKGKLDGREIAVKRLSESSTQGLNEFKTEVNLVAKLQHRNLVQLLGYCIEDEERMLIYEYMENGSLDAFILDGRNNSLLTWQKCLDIIIGIARGLLYLHEDSRLKIIHRDLKTSNILLDKDLNPKISDFGMARILKAGQLDDNTRRVVGTYGYMAPEYAIDGLFSEKSDVFSFGVIVLKILVAKSCIFLTQIQHMNLVEHVWKLWKKDKGMELVEGAIGLSSNHAHEVLKCIQIGLLCVEENSEDRPTMHNVVLMLFDESIMVPLPKQPGFCYDNRALTSSSIDIASNEVTSSMIEGR